MTVGDELHECEAESHGNPAGESSQGGLTRLTFTHDDDGRHATASTHVAPVMAATFPNFQQLPLRRFAPEEEQH